MGRGQRGATILVLFAKQGTGKTQRSVAASGVSGEGSFVCLPRRGGHSEERAGAGSCGLGIKNQRGAADAEPIR